MKQEFLIDMKIKVRHGRNYKTVDRIKQIGADKAILILQQKYLSSTKHKTLMQKFEIMYQETTKELEKALEKR